MKFIKMLFLSLLCFGLFACSAPEIKVKDDNGQSNQSNKEVYKDVETYVGSTQYQDKIEDTIETMDGWGLTLSVYGEGNTVVYSYTYKEQVDLSEDAKASILESIKSQASVYASILDQIEKETAESQPQIKVVYCNADGSVLVEHTFTK